MSLKYEVESRYVGGAASVKAAVFENYNIYSFHTKRIKSGIINTSFLLDFLETKKVFRIYRQGNKKLPDIERELRLCKKLQTAGVPVPSIFANNSGTNVTLCKINNTLWFGVLFEYIPGQHIKPHDHQLIDKVSTLQAEMHKALSLEKVKESSFVSDLVRLINKEYRKVIKTTINQNLLEEMGALCKSVVADLRKYKSAIDSLPFGYCHLDYDSSNILTNGKQITGIVDFDDMAPAPFVADIAFSLWWWLFFNDFDHEILIKYLKSYEKTRKLTRMERGQIITLIRARNMFLMTVLFINQEKVSEKNVKKAIKFDSYLRNYEENPIP